MVTGFRSKNGKKQHQANLSFSFVKKKYDQ